jgi:outer membrane protein assembly factor BamB
MVTLRLTLASAALVTTLGGSTGTGQAPSVDWPQWRGPNRDGVSRETGLLKQWPAQGPRLVWKASGVHDGYSSMAVTGGRLYTMGARGDTEYVLALDASSGKQLWSTANGRRFSNDKGDGPRGTPTVDGDRLYVLGASGDLTALEAATGRKVWSINVLATFGGHNPRWGLSESPLVVDDRILVNAGGRGAAVVALKKADGALIWKSQDDAAAYSSAMMADVGGLRHAVFFTADRVVGVGLNDGRLLWSYDRVTNRTANIATPLVRANRVFVSSDYGTGGALLQLAAREGGLAATEVWFNRDMRNHHASAVWIGSHLYGFSSAILTAMEVDTGRVAWRDRSVGKGSLVYADERLYLFSEDGVVGLAEADPSGYKEHGRFRLPSTGSLPTWSHPVVSGGRLFLRDQDTIYAYDVRAQGGS